MDLDYFGLSEEPFSLTANPKFLHLTAQHRDALTNTLRWILMRRGLMLMVGPIGTGKTLLMNALQLLLSTDYPNIATAFIVNPKLTPSEFLEYVLGELEIPCASSSKPARLMALHHFLLDVKKKGGTTALIIDEAHLLDVDLLEEIRLLGNFDMHTEKLLQILLCGQPELCGLLLKNPELMAFRQRVSGIVQLRSLDLSETMSYVYERLRAAGYNSERQIFPIESLDLIFAATTGIPRLINILCHESLELAAAAKAPEVSKEILRKAIGHLAVGADEPAFPPSARTQEQPPIGPTLSSLRNMIKVQ